MHPVRLSRLFRFTHIVMLLLFIVALTACGRNRQAQRSSQVAPVEPTSAQQPESVATTPAEQAASRNSEGSCGVKAVNFIGLGGEVDWSPDGEQLIFDRRDDAGIYQLFLMAPDGSNEQCISCAVVDGGPTLDRHKGFPAWHPSGDYIVTQVEMEKHWPLKKLTEPGRGAWNNLFVVTPDGQQWTQLTEYSGAATTGVLNPRFSHDGTKLLWAEKIGRVNKTAPFAQWQLTMADFVVGEEGPHLENITSIKPGEGTFYESHGFSRDDQKILFTSDIGLSNAFGLDIFIYTLASGELVNLTNSPDEWDEHATYASHGDKIAFMSSICCEEFSVEEFSFLNLSELQSEAYVMNADGSNWQQLTHFNTPGFTESSDEPSVATVVGWHPDGTRLAVAQLFTGASYDATEGRKLWIVDFNDVCQ